VQIIWEKFKMADVQILWSGGSIRETGNNVEVVVRICWAQQKYGPVLAHKRGHGPTHAAFLSFIIF
jgi:hypothetical protein